MTGHPDPEILAEFREGLLGWRRARRIRAHLAGCARCDAVNREIAAVSSLLASAPAPRMPDHLARRLEAVLVAESAARAAQADDQETAKAADPATGGVQDGDLVPEPGRAGQDGRDRWHQPAGCPGDPSRPGRADQPRDTSGTGQRGRAARGRRPAAPRVPALRAAAIAAAVVVIAGGGYGLARVLSGPAGHGAAAGAARPATNHPGASTNQPAGGGTTSGAKSSAGSPAEAAGTLPLIHSGTDYQPGRLVAQVERVLRQGPAYRSLPGDFGPLLGNRGLSGCVLLITGGVRPRLVDEARYRGQPATVIVTAGAGGRPGQVWVAGSGCSASRPDVIARAQLTGTG